MARRTDNRGVPKYLVTVDRGRDFEYAVIVLAYSEEEAAANVGRQKSLPHGTRLRVVELARTREFRVNVNAGVVDDGS